MYSTAQLLHDLTAQTENHLKKAIEAWQMLPPERLAAAPAPGKWSAAQCLEHLNFYGNFYVPAIEKAIEKALKQGNRPTDTFRPGWLGGRFTQMMLPGKDGYVKNKMSAPRNAVPSPTPDPVAMLAEFIAQREKMIGLLDRAAQVNLNTVRVPISISKFIRLKLGDVFMFMTAHDHRHLLQAERALNGQ